MNDEDRLAPDLVGRLDRDAAVEPTGPQQRLIQHVRAVGGRQHDDALARAEAIHLGQDLVERLLLLAATAAVDHPAPRPANRVELVDEDDGRGGLTSLLEQVAHATGAHAHDHLHELAGAHAEERHPGLAGDRLGEQRLARAGRADQQHAFGRGPAQPGVLLWVLQEVDDLDQLGLGLVDPGHVGEGDLVVASGRLVVPFRLALAHPEEAASGAAAAADEPEEGADEQDRRAEAEEQRQQRIARLVDRPGVDDDAVRVEQRLDPGSANAGRVVEKSRTVFAAVPASGG